MRTHTVDEDDPGYQNWLDFVNACPDSHVYGRVFYNGLELSDVVGCDTDEGWVEVPVLDNHCDLIVDNDGVVTKRLYGDVEIRVWRDVSEKERQETGERAISLEMYSSCLNHR